MAVPPRLPTSLDAKDMAWARWVTQKLQEHETSQSKVTSNSKAANQQRATQQAAHATKQEESLAMQAILPLPPVAPPQQPTMPDLSTDHGTVTIRWDGQMHANLTYVPVDGDDNGPTVDPAQGFAHVNAWRANSAAGPWTAVGGNMSRMGTLVDTDVAVGSEYFYYLITTDTAGAAGSPSPIASVTVKGVDLGTLDQDVTDALSAAQAAGQAGQNAAAAAATAAQTADAKAAQALLNASTAQQKANDAYAAAENATGTTQVYIGTTAPTNTSGQLLWIDTTNGANTPKVYKNGAWTAVTDKAATDAATAAANAATAASNAQKDATQALTNAATADGKAVTAQNTANGKNTVTYATTVPSNTTNKGTKQGDLWFVQDATGNITGQYVWTGTAWQSQALTNSVIATLDAGKITSGYISANRINSNTITASMMVAGTITAASGILADAVVTSAKIADLAVNNAKINDLDGNKIQAGTVVAGKLSADSVVTNNIKAGAVDTNRIAAGAITADKLSVGTVAQTTSPSDRVPMDLLNQSWWATALTNFANATGGYGQLGVWTHFNENGRVSATAGGLAFNTDSTTRAIVGVTPTSPPPPTYKINIQWKADKAITVQVRADAGGATQWGTLTTSAQGLGTFTLPSNTVSYGVYFMASPNSGIVTLSDAHVFEVMGGDITIGPSAQLSPAGLQLFVPGSDGPVSVIDLTTNSSQAFRVSDLSDPDAPTVASIAYDGSAAFNGEVTSNTGVNIAGYEMVDNNNPESIINAAPNGSSWDSSVPLLDRFARGVIYDVTWPSVDGKSITAQYQRFAQDQFTLEDGRCYEFIIQDGGLQTAKASNVNTYLEFQINLSPNADIQSGQTIQRSVIYGFKNTSSGTNPVAPGNPGTGYWAMPPVVWTASSQVTTIDTANRLLPAGRPIYWQLNFNLSATPSAAYVVNEFGYSRGITVLDVGSAYLTRPNGNDGLANVQDLSTGGASSGSTSGGTTATSKTVTFTAKSSRTWNNGGNTIVSGSGQYTNGASMYYGTGASDMGSWFGQFRDSSNRSLNSVVGGKTVTAASLYVKNTYTYSSSGSTVKFGTGSMDTAPGSIGTPTNNTWTTSFNPGQSKTMTLNSTIRGGLSSGGVQSFVLGVGSGHAGAYSYFQGATQSNPPKLTVTYH